MSRMFNSLCYTLIFSLAFLDLRAQSEETIVVSGFIMDKATMLPLPYTSLAIRNASLGTIANEAGEFRITIPGKLIKDTLVISYVGYAKQVYPISTLASKVPLNIFLVQETTQLREVVVRDTRLDANEIMEKAVGAIKKNYPTAAFMMEGFFREIIQEDMQYVDLTESAIRVYDK